MEYKIQQQLIFFKVVIEKYNIDKELTPVNLGNGELDKVILSDLRKELDFCFDDIEYYTEKEMLIDYIEDYLISLRYKVITQKRKVKRLKKKIKHFDKIEYNIEENEIREELGQEEYILIYLLEQQFFIRSWVNQKRTEYNELPEKELKSKERERENIKKLLEKVRPKEKLKNKYDEVFINAQSYHIFNDYITSINFNHLTEFSFIYRIMLDEGLIYNTIKVNTYKKWVNEEFEKDISIKQLSTISIKHRLEKYNTLKELYKPFDSLK